MTARADSTPSDFWVYAFFFFSFFSRELGPIFFFFFFFFGVGGVFFFFFFFTRDVARFLGMLVRQTDRGKGWDGMGRGVVLRPDDTALFVVVLFPLLLQARKMHKTVTWVAGESENPKLNNNGGLLLLIIILPFSSMYDMYVPNLSRM